MLQIFGSWMFFMASAMHIVNVYLAFQQEIREDLIGGKTV